MITSHEPFTALNAGGFKNATPENPAGSPATRALPTSIGALGSPTALRFTFTVTDTKGGGASRGASDSDSVDAPPNRLTPLGVAPVSGEITIIFGGGGSSISTDGSTSLGPILACANTLRSHLKLRNRTA